MRAQGNEKGRGAALAVFRDGKRFNPNSFHPEKTIIVTMKLAHPPLRGFETLHQGNRRQPKATSLSALGSATDTPELPTLTKCALFLDGAWKEGVGTDRSAISVSVYDGVNYYLIDAGPLKLIIRTLRRKIQRPLRSLEREEYSADVLAVR